MNKKQHAILITALLLAILPVNVFAQYSSSETTKSCGTSNASSWVAACKNKYGIKIKASAYNRDTGINSNVVNQRKITITATPGVEYKIRIFIADYGNLDKLEVEGKDSIDKDDLESENIKLKKANMTTGLYEYNLPAGKEALVIAYLKNNEDSGVTCQTADKTKHAVKCKAGNYSIEDNEGTVKGNAASLFVENPNDTGLVTNLRYRGNSSFGTACNNSYNGYYMGSNAEKKEDSKYTVAREKLGDWQQNFYTKVLGNNYCDKQSVAFNLKESQIINISNKLLKVYYESNKLQSVTTDSYEKVKSEIEAIRNSINDESRIFYESKGQQPNVTGLTCDENATTTESKDYLYITKEENIKTDTLSNGRKYNVCTTQCYEHLTVSYSPPVASKAGLCFTYKVTVKSETKCGVNASTDYLNGLFSKEACSPTPVCENDTSKTQAGPSQEFDDCVKECDGGEYSQSCINKCYKKVYSKNNTKSNSSKESNKVKTSNTSTKKSNIVPTLNNLTGNKATVKRMFDIKNEDNLSKYYEEGNNPDCNTKKLIKWFRTSPNTEKQNTCAEYYFYAKMLNPYGHYNAAGTTWKPDNVITNAGATTIEPTNIAMQIGRASPFYLRDIDSTKDLLKSLVGYNDSTGTWKKYNIKSSGVKRQYSSRYICKESCKFSGCDSSKSLTPHDFVGNTADDLRKINEALEKCTTTAACDGANETTDFEIKIENPRQNDKPTQNTTVTGKTNIHEETSNTTTVDTDTTCGEPASAPSGDRTFSMFVPAEDDDLNKTRTGITGYCYDENVTSPHYKTTITFPGSWINLKTGEVSYKDKCANYFDYQDELFCSMYDSANVNTTWWKWRINSERTGSAPKPDSYNITATLGKNNAKFGKYHWTVDYKCFYAISDTTGSSDTTDDNTPASEQKTSPENVDTRFVQVGKELFPNNRTPGFNWTSAATDIALRKEKCNSETTTCEATKGYDIDPGKYIEEIKTTGDAVYNETPEVHIQINGRQDFNTIGQYTSKISKFDGSLGNEYTKTDIDGLYYYTSDTLKRLRGNIKKLDISYERGKNYK